MQRFDTPGHVRLLLHNPSGWAHVTCDTNASTEVELVALSPESEPAVEAAEVRCWKAGADDVVEIRIPEQHLAGWRALLGGSRSGVGVTLRCPPGSDLAVTSASADLVVSGDLGELRSQSASGDVEVASLSGSSTVRTASGDVRLRWAGGNVEVATVSGDVRLEHAAGELFVRTMSGDVRIDRSGERATVRTVSGNAILGQVDGDLDAEATSGDLRVGPLWRGVARLSSVSGDVTVSVARGTLLAVDASSVSGRSRSEIPLDAEPGSEGSILELRLRTVSGDIEIRRGPAVSPDPVQPASPRANPTTDAADSTTDPANPTTDPAVSTADPAVSTADPACPTTDPVTP